MMGNPNERLMDVGIGEALGFFFRTILQLQQLLVQYLDVIIEQDGRHHG
jgi:hypothetical protein